MSEPIITFNNNSRALRVEHDGWYLEVKVIASGRQIVVTANGSVDGNDDLVIRPATSNRVFISSRASERTPDGETTTTPTQQTQPDSGNRRSTKR